jgi:thiol-disulfide isomerase/thioredoxin
LLIGVLAQNLSGCTEEKQGYPKAGDAFPLAALNQIKILGNKAPELKNKTLLINFWATWCTPCRNEMPHLQQLSEALDRDKFEVVGISVDDDTNLVKEFLMQYQIRFANLQDEDPGIASGIIKRISGGQVWDEKFLERHLQSSLQFDAHSIFDRAFG